MYVINLDPANGTYLVSCDVRSEEIFSPLPATRVTGTGDKTRAKRYPTYHAAQEEASDIRGWGGRQRVEEVMRVNIDFDHTSDGFGELE